MENVEGERDYDENPIVIKDYNNIFFLLFGIYCIPVFLYFYFVNPGDLSDNSKFVHFFILIPVFILPSFKRIGKTIGKRYIKLTNDSIVFLQDTKIISEIKIKDVKKINRTYHDYYHISQVHKNSLLGKVLNIILVPVYQIILIINKFLFHLKMHGVKNYKLLDAIIIFSEDNFITILPTNSVEKEDLVKYFLLKKGINLKKQDSFFIFSYKEDEIKV